MQAFHSSLLDYKYSCLPVILRNFSGIIQQFTFSRNASFQPATLMKRKLFQGHKATRTIVITVTWDYFNLWNTIMLSTIYLFVVFKSSEGSEKHFATFQVCKILFYHLSEAATGGVIKKAVLKYFAIFTGKHLCWSLLLLKLQI